MLAMRTLLHGLLRGLFLVLVVKYHPSEVL